MKPLAEIIDPGWAEALAPVEPEIRAMGDFLRSQPAYLPAGADAGLPRLSKPYRQEALAAAIEEALEGR